MIQWYEYICMVRHLITDHPTCRVSLLKLHHLAVPVISSGQLIRMLHSTFRTAMDIKKTISLFKMFFLNNGQAWSNGLTSVK